MNTTKSVTQVYECFVQPKYPVKEAKQPFYLTPMDLFLLSIGYGQRGLLYPKPSHLNGEIFSIQKLLQSLKHSLSLTLVHFYPLAGRLESKVDQVRHSTLIYVDCNKGPGAKFIHASLDMSISDILSPTDVPLVVHSFFDRDLAVNYDGHTKLLLSVQVTELVDGIFIGCSLNHSLCDGTSYWHFWNVWSEIHQANSEKLSVERPPSYERWFPEGHGPELPLPFVSPDEFVNRFESPELRERVFHFSAESIARLKRQANKESNTDKISSFQALSAFCWRATARANRLPLNEITNCRLAVNNRRRIIPPLAHEYFGNFVVAMKTSTTVDELHKHNLGWAASLLNQSVSNHDHKAVEDSINGWLESPYVHQLGRLFDPNSVMMSSSPRFNVYGNEFGLGKAVAVLTGYSNKFVGKIASYPGYEGGGSVDLEICLAPDAMCILESDQEFMGAVSQSLKTTFPSLN